MSSENLKITLFILMLLPAGFFSLPANPFLGSQEDATPQVARTGGTSRGMVESQLTLRKGMADLLLSVKEGRSTRVLLLLYGLAFLYGMLHAAGPGHRKTVVFSLYLSRDAKWYEPLGFGLLLSFLHGGSAILLILLYKTSAGPLLSRTVNATSLQMEGWAYTLLFLLSLLLLTSALKQAFCNQKHSHGQKRSLFAIALTGFFPCPGAIMILIFTLTQDLLLQGVITVSFMSLGMAIPVSSAAYLAYLGKKGLFSALQNNEKLLRRISSGLEIGAYTFLLIFSLLMVQPFLLAIYT